MRATLLVMVTAIGVMAQQRFDLRVRDDMFAGMMGDRTRLERGIRVCEQAPRRDPRNAQALVWHGSGLVTKATWLYTAGDSARGDKMFQQGISEVNRGRDLAPNDIGVLIGRSALLVGMAQSGFDPRDEEGRKLPKSAVDDYEVVLAKQQSISLLSQHSRCELLFGLAAGWSRLAQAGLDPADRSRRHLDGIVPSCAGSQYESEARAWLAKPAGTFVDHNCVGCHVSEKRAH